MSLLKILIRLFFNIYRKYSIVLICGSILGNFRALMFFLATYKPYLSFSWCLICNNVLLSFAKFYFCELLQVLTQNFSEFDFFVISFVISRVICHMMVLFATYCMFFAIFHSSHDISFCRTSFAPHMSFAVMLN